MGSTARRWAAGCLAALVLLLLGGGTAWAASGNLLLNASFEEGDTFWDAYSFPSAIAVQENSYYGAWSLRVGPAGGGRAQLLPHAQAGATYTLSCYAMVTDSSDPGYIGIEYYDLAGNRFVDGFTITDTTYRAYSKDITLSATLGAPAQVYVWKNDGPGYLYTDAFSLVDPALSIAPGNTTYYVDAVAGNDAASGTSSATPWRSLEKLNHLQFQEGTKILFKAGGVWTGALSPWGSAVAGNPIIISRYGTGATPVINGNGTQLATLRLFNQEYWDIGDLEITNTAPARTANLTGVTLALQGFGTAHGLRLHDLFIHDVNGSLVKDEGGGYGILPTIDAGVVPSRFDGLTIENCHLVRTDRNGIITWTDYWTRDNWYPSLSVVIRGNLLEDIGGDGIVPIGCDGVLVEHNVLRGGRTRCADYAAGMWPWSCDNSLFQYNEVSGMVGTMDGEAFDCDYNSNNTIMQYNYSHDNEGGFMLICADGSYSFNDGSIVRYNISQNDGTRLFHITGAVHHSRIYNNTFYIGPGLGTAPVVFGNWYGDPDDTLFQNNIFYDLGTGEYVAGGATNTVFDNNVFFGSHPASEPLDAHKFTDDPKLAGPGTGGVGLDSCGGYELLPDSPFIDLGLSLAGSGGFDYFGNPVPSGVLGDIGAQEYHQFLDVPKGRWGFVEIGYCVRAGVVKGYKDNTYRPGENVKRDAMAAYLARALAGGDASVPAGPTKATFSDVATDHWAYDYVEFAVAQAIVKGFSDGTYRPDEPVNRAQMAAFVGRSIAPLEDRPDLTSYTPPTVPDFPDVGEEHWAYRFIEYCFEQGVVKGYADGYRPDKIVTRDQMAVYVYRALPLIPVVPSPPYQYLPIALPISSHL